MSPKDKAARIRHKLAETPQDAGEAIDWGKNHELLKELEGIGRKNGVTSHIVMLGETPLCTIVFKRTEKQLTAYVTAFMNGRRLMYKRVVRGCGFDRESAALDGIKLYPHDSAQGYIFIEDGSARWYNDLTKKGCKVWQTM